METKSLRTSSTTKVARQINFLARVVEDAKLSWRNGVMPDARKVVDAYPELLNQKSLLFDLVLEDYAQRRTAGTPLGPLTYREQFESFGAPLARSIERLVSVEEAIGNGIDDRNSAAWPAPGDDLGHFGVLEELGRGSFSRVYLCTEKGVGDRQVAVKVTRRGFAEADRLGKLNHSNIVPILSVTYDASYSATLIAMPILGRNTLDDLIAIASSVPQHLQLDVVKRWFTQSSRDLVSDEQPDLLADCSSYSQLVVRIAIDVCKALEYAHSHKIAHCDVKPSNILLDSHLKPLLIDFNLSCAMASSNEVLGGTLEYMPPEFWEQVLAKDAESRGVASTPATPGADIYAVALTMAELASGRRPISNEAVDPHLTTDQAHGLQRELIEHALDHLESRDQLRRTWRRCVSTDVEQRPTAKELREAFEDELKEIDSEGELERQSRRRFMMVIGGVGAGGLIICTAPLYNYFVNSYEYHSARESLAVGDFATAESSFSRVIARGSYGNDAIYLRAWSRADQGNYVDAASDFIQVDAGRKIPHLTGCIGYCNAKLGRFSNAIYWYEFSVNGSEQVDCSVANNIGCAYWLGRNSSHELMDPKKIRGLAFYWLTKAIDAHPKAREPHINRIRFATDELLSEPAYRTGAISCDGDYLYGLVRDLQSVDYSAEGQLVSAILLSHLPQTSESVQSWAEELFHLAVTGDVGPSMDEWSTDALYVPLRSIVQAPRAWSSPGKGKTRAGPLIMKHDMQLPSELF